MKKLKYISVFALIFGFIAMSCSDELVRPLGTGGDGDEDDDDPIEGEPPAEPGKISSDTVSIY